ncbi:hypothetical protein [Frankia sp. AiPs1]|uniref:hypothetical protein n=1 Tax=Frankia sp. AiPs1 TaxID=573493 RepID=UPI0027E2390D|nr:hypothetical protein [Frankia sp. AiPs1]
MRAQHHRSQTGPELLDLLEPGGIGRQRHLDVGEPRVEQAAGGVLDAGEVPHPWRLRQHLVDGMVDARDVALAAAFEGELGPRSHDRGQISEDHVMIGKPVEGGDADNGVDLGVDGQRCQ